MLYSNEDLARPADTKHNRPHQRTPYGEDAASDYGRVVHSKCFRRLQGKMQLFPPSTSPLLRNRLTHSLEVADIASRIARHLNRNFIVKEDRKIDVHIVSAVALAHDLGHPPFGHTGEKILARIMAQYGSFEGNAQTLRIITRLENRFVRNSTEEPDLVYADPLGLNLMYRTIASVIKYDDIIINRKDETCEVEAAIAKGYYADDKAIVDDVKKAVIRSKNKDVRLRTIECQIMDLADDIAYSTYDFEDCMIAGFTHPLDFIAASDRDLAIIAKKTNKTLQKHGYDYNIAPVEIKSVYQMLFRGIIRKNKDSNYRERSEIDRAAFLGWNYQNSLDLARDPLRRRKMTETLIEDAIRGISLGNWNDTDPALSQIKIDPQQLLFIETLKHYNFIHTIMSRGLQLYAKQAEIIVETIFKTISEDDNGTLLPEDWRAYYQRIDNEDLGGRMRLICDYISSLTDAEAVAVYASIRTPNAMPEFRRW